MFHVKHRACCVKCEPFKQRSALHKIVKGKAELVNAVFFFYTAGRCSGSPVAERLLQSAFEDYENAAVDGVILAHVDLFNAN